MKCGSRECRREATRLVLWPGKDTPMCWKCVRRAISVAEAMGFILCHTTLDALERELAAHALRKMGVGCSLCQELGAQCHDCRNGLAPGATSG